MGRLGIPISVGLVVLGIWLRRSDQPGRRKAGRVILSLVAAWWIVIAVLIGVLVLLMSQAPSF